MAIQSKTQPICRVCGKPIPKFTGYHLFRVFSGTEADRVTNLASLPQTREEAQRHVNQQIVSVEYAYREFYDDQGVRHKGERQGIAKVTTWDGESYVDPYFCNGAHAKRFAYMVAEAEPELGTKAYRDARQKRVKK